MSILTDAQTQYIKNYIKDLSPTLAGRLLYYCVPFRKKVVLDNMRQVFGDQLTPQEIHKLAKGFYSHVATSLKENILLRFMNLEQIRQRAVIVGDEYMWALEKGPTKGALLITGHFGNWEFAPIAGILNFPQLRHRFYVVRKYISAKWIEKILFRRYYQAGLNVIPKKNALEKVCEALETDNVVAFILDQHASLQAKDGLAVEFFGKPAGTFRSPAMIARHTGVPVLGFRAYRRKDGKHVLEFLPCIPWISHEDSKEELRVNTRNYNQLLEKFILEYPDQWLWMHRRWKI